MSKNHQQKANKLKRVRLVRYLLNVVGLLVIGYGLWLLGTLILNYKRTETTNNAQVEQYLSPVNVRVSGYIADIFFTEHQYVQQGDTLLVIDDREFRLKMKDAESRLELARLSVDMAALTLNSAKEKVQAFEANIRELTANIKQQEADYNRYRNLLERKAATPIQVERMKTNLDMSQAKMEALLTQKSAAVLAVEEAGKRYENAVLSVPIAEAAMETAALNLSYTVVTAPCSGYLGRRSLEVGQLVNAAQTITQIIPDTQKWIVANYKETQIENLYVGQEVVVRIDAISDRSFSGKITAISDATGGKYSMVPTDNSAGNFVKIQQRIPVRIEFTDLSGEDNNLLRAGMMAVVSAKL